MGLIGRQEVRADNAPDFITQNQVPNRLKPDSLLYIYIIRTNIFNLSGTP